MDLFRKLFTKKDVHEAALRKAETKLALYAQKLAKDYKAWEEAAIVREQEVYAIRSTCEAMLLKMYNWGVFGLLELFFKQAVLRMKRARLRCVADAAALQALQNHANATQAWRRQLLAQADERVEAAAQIAKFGGGNLPPPPIPEGSEKRSPPSSYSDPDSLVPVYLPTFAIPAEEVIASSPAIRKLQRRIDKISEAISAIDSDVRALAPTLKDLPLEIRSLGLQELVKRESEAEENEEMGKLELREVLHELAESLKRECNTTTTNSSSSSGGNTMAIVPILEAKSGVSTLISSSSSTVVQPPRLHPCAPWVLMVLLAKAESGLDLANVAASLQPALLEELSSSSSSSSSSFASVITREEGPTTTVGTNLSTTASIKGTPSAAAETLPSKGNNDDISIDVQQQQHNLTIHRTPSQKGNGGSFRSTSTLSSSSSTTTPATSTTSFAVTAAMLGGDPFSSSSNALANAGVASPLEAAAAAIQEEQHQQQQFQRQNSKNGKYSTTTNSAGTHDSTGSASALFPSVPVQQMQAFLNNSSATMLEQNTTATTTTAAAITTTTASINPTLNAMISLLAAMFLRGSVPEESSSSTSTTTTIPISDLFIVHSPVLRENFISLSHLLEASLARHRLKAARSREFARLVADQRTREGRLIQVWCQRNLAIGIGLGNVVDEAHQYSSSSSSSSSSQESGSTNGGSGAGATGMITQGRTDATLSSTTREINANNNNSSASSSTSSMLLLQSTSGSRYAFDLPRFMAFDPGAEWAAEERMHLGIRKPHYGSGLIGIDGIDGSNGNGSSNSNIYDHVGGGGKGKIALNGAGGGGAGGGGGGGGKRGGNKNNNNSTNTRDEDFSPPALILADDIDGATNETATSMLNTAMQQAQQHQQQVVSSLRQGVSGRYLGDQSQLNNGRSMSFASPSLTGIPQTSFTTAAVPVQISATLQNNNSDKQQQKQQQPKQQQKQLQQKHIGALPPAKLLNAFLGHLTRELAINYSLASIDKNAPSTEKDKLRHLRALVDRLVHARLQSFVYAGVEVVSWDCGVDVTNMKRKNLHHHHYQQHHPHRVGRFNNGKPKKAKRISKSNSKADAAGSGDGEKKQNSRGLLGRKGNSSSSSNGGGEEAVPTNTATSSSASGDTNNRTAISSGSVVLQIATTSTPKEELHYITNWSVPQVPPKSAADAAFTKDQIWAKKKIVAASLPLSEIDLDPLFVYPLPHEISSLSSSFLSAQSKSGAPMSPALSPYISTMSIASSHRHQNKQQQQQQVFIPKGAYAIPAALFSALDTVTSVSDMLLYISAGVDALTTEAIARAKEGKRAKRRLVGPSSSSSALSTSMTEGASSATPLGEKIDSSQNVVSNNTATMLDNNTDDDIQIDIASDVLVPLLVFTLSRSTWVRPHAAIMLLWRAGIRPGDSWSLESFRLTTVQGAVSAICRMKALSPPSAALQSPPIAPFMLPSSNPDTAKGTSTSTSSRHSNITDPASRATSESQHALSQTAAAAAVVMNTATKPIPFRKSLAFGNNTVSSTISGDTTSLGNNSNNNGAMWPGSYVDIAAFHSNMNKAGALKAETSSSSSTGNINGISNIEAETSSSNQVTTYPTPSIAVEDAEERYEFSDDEGEEQEQEEQELTGESENRTTTSNNNKNNINSDSNDDFTAADEYEDGLQLGDGDVQNNNDAGQGNGEGQASVEEEEEEEEEDYLYNEEQDGEDEDEYEELAYGGDDDEDEERENGNGGHENGGNKEYRGNTHSLNSLRNLIADQDRIEGAITMFG